jgi:hypothetical protein
MLSKILYLHSERRRTRDLKMSEKKVVLTLGTMAILFLTIGFSLARASSIETVQVGALSEQMLVFNLKRGQKFTGSLAISGGSGNDINFWVADPQGTTILNLGRVSQGKSFDFTAQSSGAYTFHFDNSFSLLSSKTVSLTYDIGLPSIFGIDLGTFLIIIGVVVILLFMIVALAVALNRRKRTAKTNQPPPSNLQQPKIN